MSTIDEKTKKVFYKLKDLFNVDDLKIIYGNSPPDISLGNDGDLYLDTSCNQFYFKQSLDIVSSRRYCSSRWIVLRDDF